MNSGASKCVYRYDVYGFSLSPPSHVAQLIGKEVQLAPRRLPLATHGDRLRRMNSGASKCVYIGKRPLVQADPAVPCSTAHCP